MFKSMISDSLRDAQRELALLEQQYDVTTSEVIGARADDPLLERIDGFDLIEWRFRAEQIEALEGREVAPVYAYGRVRSSALVNSSDVELELAA